VKSQEAAGGEAGIRKRNLKVLVPVVQVLVARVPAEVKSPVAAGGAGGSRNMAHLVANRFHLLV